MTAPPVDTVMGGAPPASGRHAPAFSACPACAVAGAAGAAGARAGRELSHRASIVLSVPAAHCAVCIATVERALAAVPGVRAARLNLTLRRALVDAEERVTPEELITALAGAGYEAHELDPDQLGGSGADGEGRDLLMRLAVAFFSMMNVMLLSVAVWAGAEGAMRDTFHWISAAIALPTVAFSGVPFFRSAWRGLRVGRFGMDFPISIALVLASALSLFETVHSGHHAYFDAAVMLCFFLLIGRYLDFRARAAARSAARELTALEVPRAILLRDGAEVSTPIAEVRAGDLVLVRPGGRIPVDGIISDGTSDIDRSLLTGESMPVPATPGAAVSAGEVNLTGPLTVRVSAAGKDTSLHRIADLVGVAEAARTRYTPLAERAARLYSPLVHLAALGAFSWWLWRTGGDVRLAANVAVAVLIITCPCALGLAVPAVVTAASGRLFRRGLLIKDGTALERLARVDTVVFDKTGTLTIGQPEPGNLADAPQSAAEVAHALARASTHPLAVALARGLEERGIPPAGVRAIREVPGHGVEGDWRGRRVRLGRAGWTGAANVARTATHLDAGDGAPVTFTFADHLRPGAADVVRALRQAGFRVILLSGDTPGVVGDLAARLGITEWAGGVLPADKARRIRELKEAGAHVLMVGDGLNDTAALTEAQVSISPASALDAARTASDIVQLGQNMRPVVAALRTGRRARRRILENFAISASYNVIAVPLAFAGHATPLAAAIAMSLSSITVSLNALRLK